MKTLTVETALAHVFSNGKRPGPVGRDLGDETLRWIVDRANKRPAPDQAAAKFLLEKTTQEDLGEKKFRRVSNQETPDSGEIPDIDESPAEARAQAVPHRDEAVGGVASGLAFLDPADFPDLSQYDAGMLLARQYRYFTNPGETVRCIFSGMDEIPSRKGGMAPAAVFQEAGGVFVSSATDLVDQVKLLHPGAPVEIKYIGDKITKGRNTLQKFEVRQLDYPKKKR